MAELLDSGARREFSSGAVRDIAEGKGRCDLLPLGEIGNWLCDYVFHAINRYVRAGKTEDLWGAICEFCRYREWGIYTAMLEVSKQYEDGAKKYNERNWELGQNLHCYIDSGVRHYLKWRRGDTDEPHDRAFVWNMLGAIWTHENKPELIDLPFADKPIAAHRPTQAEIEDLFAPEAKAEPAEPVEGKYEGLSNQELETAICCGMLCAVCPTNINAKEKGTSCGEYPKRYPEEFRKAAIEWLEEHDAKK